MCAHLATPFHTWMEFAAAPGQLRSCVMSFALAFLDFFVVDSGH